MSQWHGEREDVGDGEKNGHGLHLQRPSCVRVLLLRAAIAMLPCPRDESVCLVTQEPYDEMLLEHFAFLRDSKRGDAIAAYSHCERACACFQQERTASA